MGSTAQSLIAVFAFNVGFRTLPFAAYALFSRRHALALRLAPALVTSGALAFALSMSADPVSLTVDLAVACVYFVAMSCALYGLRRLDVAEMVSTPVLGFICLTFFLVAPAVLFRGPALLPVVAVGFDRTLGAYSFLVSRPIGPRRFGETLFFMLVDPSLVWSRRARTAEPTGVSWRCAQGLAMLALAEVVVFHGPSSYPRELSMLIDDYWGFIGGVLPWLLVHYLSASGTASWQIGILHGLGFKVEERYRYPLLARDPVDFWHRWNTYVVNWLSAYVFAPVSTYVMRRYRKGPLLAWSAGVCTAFLLSGALHLTATLLLNARFDVRILWAFMGFGGALIAYSAFKQSLSSTSVALLRYEPFLRPAGVLINFHFVIICSWYLMPALSST